MVELVTVWSVLGKGIDAFLGVRGKTVRVRFEIQGKSFKIRIPDDQYWISIKDILLNREYEYVPGFCLKNFNGLVVDAGAHVGIFSLISSMNAKKVIALEPHPMNYLMLEANLRENNVMDVMALNRALWTQKGKVKIHLGGHSGAHSVYSSSVKSFEATTTTLADIIDEFGDIDLLKIDIEGAEFDVLERMSPEVLKRINAIVGEIHLDYGDINLIADHLTRNWFNLHIYRTPLWIEKNDYSIRLHGMFKLKMMRRFVNSLTPFIFPKERSLRIMFARKTKKCA